ncbi:MAG: HPr family phosphocarrier protein [Alphaproteobacteria bacterium]
MSDAASAECTAVIVNRKGLHARAAAKLVALASRFDARVEVSRNELVANGQSIMGLMMLAAARHSIVTLSATGPEARSAVEALAGLIAAGFYEQD